MSRIELNSLELNEINEFMKELGEQSFRGEQIFNYIHKNKGVKIEEITTLSKELRDVINEKSYINKIKIYERYDSSIDGTKKYLYELEDGNIIESVAMEYKHGTSACISTQVGCRMGCSFCASTKDGLIRNLTVSEMLNQVYMMEKDLEKEISNIVLMGSGEPLDNYYNVISFIKIISHKKGHNMSLRNITLSTCGIVPKIYDLAKEKMPITLAISLHSPYNKERGEIMPIAKKYSIDELLKASNDYIEMTGRRITFEYTLIEGVNDGKSEAMEMVKLFKDMNMHLNLIPLNPIDEYNERMPSNKNIEKFKRYLTDNNIRTTIRREMGRDISASCGQLRRSVCFDNNI